MRSPAHGSPRRFWLLLAIAVGILGAACNPFGGSCPEPSVALTATVTDSAMDPSGLDACRGQEVVLDIVSETDGVLHIHGYDEQVPAVPLEPGDERQLEFTADVAGQFIIELHARSGDTSTEIGVLTVNEP